MQTTESNYVTEAEGLTIELDRADRFIQLLFEELDDAHTATLNDDPRIAAWWVSTRKDVMEAELNAVLEKVSEVRATLQRWVDECYGA